MNIKRAILSSRILFLFLSLIILILFAYFRLKPIVFQTVPYTYDQGRDFLKAAEMILYTNPTFIGPTTGIMGVYHGAWWYYLLAGAFILFQGAPIGYYILIFVIQTTAFVLFWYWCNRSFDTLTALILALIVAISPIFIRNAIFAVNSAITFAPYLLVLIMSLLLMQKKQSIKHVPLLLLLGLGLGFVAEFEFAFGLLLIPIYIGILVGFHLLYRIFSSLKHVLLFLIGLSIPFIPRLLFELKNNFTQTRTLLEFAFQPQYHTPKPYSALLHDRQELFMEYIRDIFPNKELLFISLILFILFISYRLYKKNLQPPLLFLLTLLFLQFLFSTFYKDTFWPYYYDGIQFLLLLILGYTLAAKDVALPRFLRWGKIILLSVLLFTGIRMAGNNIHEEIPFDGLRVQQQVVDFIQSHDLRSNDYCVSIYTPPVIPYTYNYLFLYNDYAHSIPRPQDGWVHDQCWYIIESDDYEERRSDWITRNIPPEAEQIVSTTIKDIEVGLWKK